MSSPGQAKVHIIAQAYHLRYVADEDRIVLCVDLSGETELAMPITRRLTRNFLMALAKFVAERTRANESAVSPDARDAVLDFEHSKAVAHAVADGAMREEARKKPLSVASKPAREVNITPKAHGGLALSFDNSEQSVALEVSAERIHMVIETFVRMAERAGWDFPPVASWLDPAKRSADAQGRVIN